MFNVTMKSKVCLLLVIFSGVLFFGVPMQGSAHHAPKRWRISIKPKGGGSVLYTISAPSETGTLTSSKTLKIDAWAFLDLTFTPSNAYKIKAVYKNKEDITSQLDLLNHHKFEFIDSSASIKVIFEAITPEGNHNIAFPDDPPENLAPVADITGNYTGKTKHSRTYNLDAAVDEAGKVMVLGTVTGFVSDKTGEDLIISSKMKTIKKVPRIKCRQAFKGTLDGVSVKGNGTVNAPITLNQNTSSEALNIAGDVKSAPQYFGEADLKYVAHKDSVKYHDKLVPLKKEASAKDVTTITSGKKWSIKLTVTEENVTVGKKIKKIVYVAGVLTLPNDVVIFKKVKVRYKVSKGITVNFRKGIALNGEIDKKSKVFIRKMTLYQEADKSWTISGGTIIYKIMNQKGKGNLLDFTTN